MEFGAAHAAILLISQFTVFIYLCHLSPPSLTKLALKGWDRAKGDGKDQDSEAQSLIPNTIAIASTSKILNFTETGFPCI